MGVLTTYEFTQDALRRQELFKIEPKNEEKDQPTELLKEKVEQLKTEDKEESE